MKADFRKIMELGTTAQTAMLMKHWEEPGHEDLTLMELKGLYIAKTEEIDDAVNMEKPDLTLISILSAEACNLLYEVMWYCEKLMKIKDSKRRKQDAKKMVKEMARD